MTLFAILKTIKKNFVNIFIFESLHKLFIFLILSPIIHKLLNFTIKASSNNFINTSNLLTYILSPITLLFIVLLLILLCFLIYLEVFFLINIYRTKGKFNFTKTFFDCIDSCKKLNKNKYILVFILLIYILSNIFLLNNHIYNLKIAESLSKIINKSQIFLVFNAIMLFLLFIFIKFGLSTFHFFIIDKKDFKSSMKKSNELSHGNKFKMFLDFIFLIISYFLAFFILIIIALAVVKILDFLRLENKHLRAFLLSPIILSFLFFRNALFLPVIIAFMDFYYLKDKNIEKNNKSDYSHLKMAGIILLILFLFISLDTFKFDGKIRSSKNDYQVVAHRGDSLIAPENTEPAFLSAIKKSVDIIELDIRQVVDGELILMHDDNFERLAGIDKFVWNLNLKEAKAIDIGIKFSDKYKNLSIITLDEALKIIDKKAIVNIEIKSGVCTADFYEKIVDVIEENNYEKYCIVSSFRYESLAMIKEINPELKTMYILSFLRGRVDSLKYADSFSIKESIINKELVDNIHENKKEVYVWTANKKEDMYNLFKLDIDGLVSDNIDLAIKVRDSKKDFDILGKDFLKYIIILIN